METTTLDRAMAKVAEAPQQHDVWRGQIKVGQHVRQGDVHLLRVAPNGETTVRDQRVPITLGKRLHTPGADVQIALGEHAGARHVVHAADGVSVYAAPIEHPLIGPVIVVGRGATALVSHPEHRHFDLPCGTYLAVYQRDFMAEEVSRLAD